MEFELLELSLVQENGVAHIKFKIKTDGTFIEHDKELKWEKKEDVDLLRAIGIFIEAKVVK